MVISTDIIEDVEKIRETEPKLMSALTAIAAYLVVKRKAYYEKVRPAEVMCHTANRGTLMLNAYQVHRNGRNLKRIGANRTLLDKQGVVFSLPTSGPRLEAQVKGNEQLIASSNEMLAPLNGGERFASVATGHTFALCRAVVAKCKTPEQELMDTDGRLHLSVFGKDAEFAEMVNEGWTVLVLPADAEDAWPWLPDFIQRAANSSHSVQSTASELEVAASMAELAELRKAASLPIDWDWCKEQAIAGGPPCAAYADALQTICMKFSGGDGAPLLRFMDDFAKKFVPNVKLGEEFCRALATTELHFMKSRVRPRAALCLSNLIAKKLVDGVAQLHKKSDIVNLGTKKNETALEALNDDLATADKAVDDMLSKELISHSSAITARGLFYVRRVCVVTQKKGVMDCVEYKTVDDVRQLFNLELQQGVLALTKMEPTSRRFKSIVASLAWTQSPDKQQPKTDAACVVHADPNRSVDYAESIASMAGDMGIKVGTLWTERKSQPPPSIWEVTSVTDNVSLKELTLGRKEPRVAEFEMKVFIASFKAREDKSMPKIVQGAWDERVPSAAVDLARVYTKMTSLD